MSKRIGVVLLSFLLIFSGLLLGTTEAKPEWAGKQHQQERTQLDKNNNGKVKNVIYMIPDGFNADYATNYRWYKGDDAVWDEHLKGMFKTYSANSRVTDSAAAGTAMATGVKTNNGVVGLDKDGNKVETILEASKKEGKSTGLVATSTITHATPAVFAAHVESRNNQAVIAKQYIANDVDVLLGGGKDYFTLESDGGKQKDDHLIEQAKDKGYTFIETRQELKAINNKDKKVLGLFANDALAPELHRDLTEEPSLAEMTTAAIDVLSQNKDGFFLMVEGSQIDWAGHAHDAAWAMSDVEAFEKAVEVAIEYAKRDGKTLVVIGGDHETGGMTVGANGVYDVEPEILKEVTATGNFMAQELNQQRSNIREVIEKYTPFTLSDEEVQVIKDSKNPANEINDILSDKVLIGWTSGAHTGVDIPVYAYGPQSERFVGLLENTDLPIIMAEVMKIELNN
ncbi:MAG TPA: alkaline phosphatase [Cerasibacillus sp.]|uniref:alkaline phosphatase n=1 Tax=Cerasibacillus sp. TaxID=2498711 RepID=UPI002F3E8478